MDQCRCGEDEMDFSDKTSVPLSLEVGSHVTSAALHSAVTLSCVAMSYPRATVTWSRGDVPWPPANVLIKSDALNHVRVLSTLTISALRRQDNGTYYCAARNEQDMLMAQQDVVVLGE
ncbi:ig-like domain-containing protein [Nephila pilipes]|uniref:Ig-like domain-containing protein n=1 Tax=Nephila pilipes TaxID=299642 RepID=A0A8X6MJ90_NEPPI|nr:ig-like domain-containing protein [Nephila pilipes]